MISPSKLNHQQHKQASRDNSDIHSHVRLQRGRKPLEKKSFYLDIKNHRLLASFEEKIKDLGGEIELFLVKSITLVVSDRADRLEQNCDKKKWGYGSGESGGIPSLKSIEVRTPISTPTTPYGAEYPLVNSTNIRSQTAQRTKSRADAMLERALTQPQQCSVDPLNNALNWGIPIWAPKRLQAWLEKIYESLKDNNNLKRNTDRSNSERSLKAKNLKNSYIKFESFKRDTRPVFLELPVWPKLNFDGDSGSCPFDTRLRDKKVCKEPSNSLNDQKGKEMIRRPRATATRGRRTEQLTAGYCEICRINYRDLSKHLQSDKHLAFVRNDDNFLSLDKLINSGASVEAFLRANEVGQDCNIYPDGDKSLHNADVNDRQVKKTGSGDLSSFTVEDIKMVQCNGARRNLNLKLSSPHNLRARSKKESGHSLRSKGSPWPEMEEKNGKFYDKFEGFTIKKRSKGTIWIEEDDDNEENPDVDKCSRINEISKIDGKSSFESNIYARARKEPRDQLRKSESLEDRILPKLERNDLTGCEMIDDNSRIVNIPRLEKETTERVSEEISRRNVIGKSEDDESRVAKRDIPEDRKNVFNGFERIDAPESFPASQLPGNSTGNEPINHKSREIEETKPESESVCNGLEKEKNCQESRKNSQQEEKPKSGKIGKRSGRGFRGRPRLSVEERLIEDNRAYYKVEVLGNKLRSSTGPWSVNTTNNGTTKISGTETTADRVRNEPPDPAIAREASGEKPVVVRFKRVRRSELSLLSDEAESFMFGEPRRDDETSETSDADQSSVMPRETESEWDSSNASGALPSSTINSSSSVKQEVDEDSQDSMYTGRAKKRRRTHTEALIKDNENYYKFETPGSRLRFQTQLKEEPSKPERPPENAAPAGNEVEKLYPSKPSPEVEKMQFSFEAVPRSEPWYQTYQRQDEGAEFWHYFSEADDRKPFLLPYEIENFHERIAKLCQKSDTRRKSRGKGRNGLARSPRKSPRCHASTLAIMSTIIRKREQTTLSVIEESPSRCSPNFDPPEIGPNRNVKSDTDVELREIANSIDLMLSAQVLPDTDDSFEAVLFQQTLETTADGPKLQPGPPPDLLDLLDNCHEYFNCLENSSCASSECGDNQAVESPLKRRKKRKNRTGWPGIKMKKKMQAKQLIDAYVARERLAAKKEANGTNEIRKDPKRLEETTTNVENPDESKTRIETKSEIDNLQDQKSVDRVSINEISNREENAKRGTPPVQCEAISGSDKLYTDDLVTRKTLKSNEIVTNDENQCRSDVNAVTSQKLTSKISTRKRIRVHDMTSEIIDSRQEIENNDNLYMNNVNSTIISRNNYGSNGMSKRRSTRETTLSGETHETEHIIDHHDSTTCQKDSLVTRKAMRTRKVQRRGTIRNEVVDYEDENCKTDTYVNSIKSSSKTDHLKGVKRRNNNEAVTSETLDSDIECALGERVSPSLLPTTELQNRRSSIEFQPVVRMMKIEDQVEMDHSILSVTVASNRRLRSSSSPRSNVQPTAKRHKRSKPPIGRWIKNS